MIQVYLLATLRADALLDILRIHQVIMLSAKDGAMKSKCLAITYPGIWDIPIDHLAQ